MSSSQRRLVVSNDFTGYSSGTNLVDHPTWLSLPGTISPICEAGTAVRPQTASASDLVSSALTEGVYPLNQYAMFQVYDTDCGTSIYVPQGVGVTLRGAGSTAENYTFYHVNIDGNEGKLQISRSAFYEWRNFLPGGNISITPQQNDKFWVEVESDGAGGCDISVYGPNSPDALLVTVNDPSELTGGQVGLAGATTTAVQPTMISVEFGILDIAGNRSISDVNGDYQVQSLGPMIANGSGLSGVTGGNVSFNGSRPYELTLSYVGDSAVDIQPFDIHDTQLYYAVLRLTLYHPEGDITSTYTQLPAAGWQSVELASATGQYMDKFLSAADDDVLEIPTTVGFSSVTLFDDGDVHYDGAVNQLTQHTRWFMDKFAAENYTWDSGTVTINQVESGIEALPPSWRSTPAPPPATVGVPYSYSIGVLLDGDRPMTLTDVGTPLPAGLSYNDSSYPEKIEGTILSGSGTIVVSGIITRAENPA